MSTYISRATNVTFSPSRAMISLFNPTDSDRIVKIFSIGALNSLRDAVTAQNTILRISSITSSSGGAYTVVLPYDSTGVSLSTIDCRSGATVNEGVTIFRRLWTSEEASSGTASIDEWQLLLPYSILYDHNVNNSNTTNITCRPGEGIAVINDSSTVGAADFFIEFGISVL